REPREPDRWRIQSHRVCEPEGMGTTSAQRARCPHGYGGSGRPLGGGCCAPGPRGGAPFIGAAGPATGACPTADEMLRFGGGGAAREGRRGGGRASQSGECRRYLEAATEDGPVAALG